MHIDMQLTTPRALYLNSTLESLLALAENNTICADQLIGDALVGPSGRIIWGIIQIMLMVMGNVGNILTLIVLNCHLMQKSGLNNLLQGLAISDIVAPTLACIPHMIYYYGPENNDNLIAFVNAYVMPVATGATFCSNWIVVTITCFRLMIVVRPLYSQVYCSGENERKALIVIFLFSTLSIVPYYYFHARVDALNVLRVVSAVLSLLGPWVICLVLWVLLIRTVNREIGAKKSKEFILHSEVVAQRAKSKSRMTRMVLIICFFNIICQLPVLVLTIFGLINGNPCGRSKALFFVCLLFLSNLLLIVNHSINFFIYSLTNPKFRLTLQVMSRQCCCYLNGGPKTRTQLLNQRTTTDEQRYPPRLTSTKGENSLSPSPKTRDTQQSMTTTHAANSEKRIFTRTPPDSVAV